MRLLTVLALAFSVTAFAGEFESKRISFSPSTHTGGGTVSYYNCDSVEDMAESHLEDLGAMNVNVRCTGGISNGWNSPAHLSGTFDAPVVVASDKVEILVLRGNDSCSLNSEFLDMVLPMFSGVTIMSRRASCWGGRMDSWKYTLSVAK